MISSMRRRTAMAVAGSVLALGGGTFAAGSARALSASAGATGWRVNQTVSIRGKSVLLNDIDAIGPADAWVTGQVSTNDGSNLGLLLEHWNGSSWARVALPARDAARFRGPDQIYSFVAASSRRDVWVIGDSGEYLQLRGGAWAAGSVPLPRKNLVVLDQAAAFSPADVWVFGTQAVGPVSRLDFRPYAARFNGKRWTRVTLPGTGPAVVSALAADDMWAVTGAVIPGTGLTATPRVLHWNGRSWRALPAQPRLPGHATLSTVLAQAHGTAWVGGSLPNRKGGTSELAWEWNGRSWAAADPPGAPSTADYYLTGLVPGGTGGLWGIGTSLLSSSPGATRIWDYADGTWSVPGQVSQRWLFLELAGVPHSASVWGIADSPGLVDGLIVLHGAVPR
jgi:hypothetical protein